MTQENKQGIPTVVHYPVPLNQQAMHPYMMEEEQIDICTNIRGCLQQP